MKCPNCSFMNPNELTKCKVCGFDLTADVKAAAPEAKVASSTTPKKSRVIDKDEEKALDTVLKTLFGLEDLEENPIEVQKDVPEDEFDVDAVKRMLNKNGSSIRMNKPISDTEGMDLAAPKLKEERDDQDEDESDEDLLAEEIESTDEKETHLKVFFIILAIAVLVFILTKSGLFDFKWKYQSDKLPEHVITTESTTSSEVDNETVEVILGDEESLVPIHTFFKSLPDFVNKGNLSALNVFTSTQEALETLTEFAHIGNLERYLSAEVISFEEEPDRAAYQIKTQLSRLIDGQQTNVDVLWDFSVILNQNGWSIESIGIDSSVSGESVSGEEKPETTEAEIAETTEKVTQATTESTTEPTTERQVQLDGFKLSGQFSGGEVTIDQDIAVARFGVHESYDRLVFEMYAYAGLVKPTQTTDAVTAYTATLSEDGTVIKVHMKGALEAYASQMAIDFKGKDTVKSISYSNASEGDAIDITIVLSQPSQFKVFSLKSPGKLVIDIAPRP